MIQYNTIVTIIILLTSLITIYTKSLSHLYLITYITYGIYNTTTAYATDNYDTLVTL